MGTYLNPGNSGFARALQSRYIDKTGLIGVVNDTINTGSNLTCISRPRRFGKSYAAQMLCAYYDRSVDSGNLFKNLKIASAPSYAEHLNKYNVIYIDMTTVIGKVEPDKFVSFLKKSITDELLADYPDIKPGADLDDTMLNVADQTGGKFIMIIDEWDAPIRELREKVVDDYLRLLRMLFKSSATTAKLFAAVYMTGILPIKKVKTQSALSDFEEYTMLDPADYEEYVGFTEEEVRDLCAEYSVNFTEMKRWYDGYEMPSIGSIYNPNSVMRAARRKRFDSYWSQSSAADNLLDFIRWDVDGLRQAIIELMGGGEIEIDPIGYNNDLTYTTRDAALTMFVHLGYLSFNQEKKTVRIPNEEVRLEFARTLKQTDNPETMKRVRESIQLIMDTIHGEESKVAEQIRRVHLESSNPLNRNSENSLRAAIQVGYFAYKDYYMKCEELASGRGYADMVYVPRKGMDIPCLVVELKWDESADTAIRQIKDKAYVNTVEGFGGDVLLVGISYDKDSGEYQCRIESWVV